jgi:hypothetical protein
MMPKSKEKIITIQTWEDLSVAILAACNLSDTRTCNPIGRATIKSLGEKIVGCEIKFDLVP